MTSWTPSKVADRLEEAAETLRRLPPVRMHGYCSTWPQILHDANDKRDWEALKTRLGPPTAKAITHMEETLTWSGWLTAEENRLLWLRANHMSWKVIGWHFGYDRTTAWKRWTYALTILTHILNRGKNYQSLIKNRRQHVSS